VTKLHPRRRDPRLGWKRDVPSIKDKLFAERPRPHGPLPDEVDLRPDAPAVRDQGNEGSCTGFGSTGALMALRKIRGCPAIQLSPQWAYYNARVIEGSTDQDDGAQIRDVIDGLRKVGAAPEEDWPYVAGQFAGPPPEACAADALKDQVLSAWRVDINPDQVMAALAQKLPIVLGISVYSSFEDIGRDGKVPMPSKRERLEGGHCMWASGYSKKHEFVIVQNSWNTSFGDDGYVYLPFSYLDRRLAGDWWAIEHVEGEPGA
jgi:C1A family cysteine protease